MLRMNSVGRFDICEAAVRAVSATGSTKFDTDANLLITYYQQENKKAEKYALEHGDDPSWCVTFL